MKWLNSYWRWTSSGPKWQWAIGLGIPAFIAVLVIGVASGSNDKKNQSENLALVNATPQATLAKPTTNSAVPTALPANLKSVSEANLLASGDLPSGFTPATIGILTSSPSKASSVVADPSSYTACGPGPALALDRGFQRAGILPALGQTLMAYPSVEAANKAMSDAAQRAQSCTKNDSVGSSTSISVSFQQVPEDLGDSVKAFKVSLAQKTGPPNIGYVILIRRTNILTALFYMNKAGTDDFDQFVKITQTAATKLDGSLPASQSVPSATVAPATAAQAPTPGTSTYRVGPGDNPTAIAIKLGIPESQQAVWIQQFLTLNNTNPGALQVGQELKVPPSSSTSALQSQASSSAPLAPTQASAPPVTQQQLPPTPSPTTAPVRKASDYIGSSNPPADFCSFAPCIPNFSNGRGTVVVCRDGMYSKSGGIQGSCSSHGGNAR